MKPRLTAYRKLSKHGNSWMIAPPRAFLQSLGLLGGELVELVLDDYAGRFYVKPIKPRRAPGPRVATKQLPLEEVL